MRRRIGHERRHVLADGRVAAERVGVPVRAGLDSVQVVGRRVG